MTRAGGSIRLLAVDIDGTLVNSQDQVTPVTREALRRAAAAGVRIVLATGRRYSRALPLAAPLGIDAPIVSASGALIKRPSDHHTLFRADFGRPTLLATLDFIHRSGYEAVLYGDTYAEGYDFYRAQNRFEQFELADLLARNLGCDRVWPDLMTRPPEGVFAGFVVGKRETMLSLGDALQRHVPDQLYTHVLRSPRYIGHFLEIAPLGVTKWSGVQRLAQEWGISDAEICAVGDDVNDVPMIEAAGLGVAMANAVPEAKSACDRVAPSHDEDGLAMVVDWILDCA